MEKVLGKVLVKKVIWIQSACCFVFSRRAGWRKRAEVLVNCHVSWLCSLHLMSVLRALALLGNVERGTSPLPCPVLPQYALFLISWAVRLPGFVYSYFLSWKCEGKIETEIFPNRPRRSQGTFLQYFGCTQGEAPRKKCLTLFETGYAPFPLSCWSVERYRRVYRHSTLKWHANQGAWMKRTGWASVNGFSGMACLSETFFMVCWREWLKHFRCVSYAS